MIIDDLQMSVKKILSKGNYFQNFIVGVIIFAGILAGVQTNHEISEKYRHFFQTFDYIIIGIFIVEMFVYMLEHGRRPLRYFRDPWHIFDFSIIVISLIPIIMPDSSTEFIVVFRLARILRLARVFEKIKNLKLILRTLFRVIPSMFYVVILLLLLFYVYGVSATYLFGQHATDEFGTLWRSMKTLLFISFEGWSGLYDSEGITALLNNGFPEWLFALFFISFQLLAALIFLNLFIGIITSDMESVREDEKRGKSPLYSSGHTLILGWSNKVFRIIDELRVANDEKEKAEIVILADKDKLDMDYEISEHFEGFSTTKVITRTGDFCKIDDLRMVNAWKAKSIIILHNFEDPDFDYKILKAIISLFNHYDVDKHSFHVVAEMKDNKVIDIAKQVDINGRLIILDSEDFISRLIANAAMNPYISGVLYEILGFQGSELYVVDIEENQVGMSYKDLIYKYEASCLVGYINESECVLNPLPEYTFNKNDKLIILAQDRSSIKYNLNYHPNVDFEKISIKEKKESNHNILIIGYNPKLPKILCYFIEYIKTNCIIKLVLGCEEEFHILVDEIKERSENKETFSVDNNSIIINFCKIETIVKHSIDSDFIADNLKGIKNVLLLADTKTYENIDEIDTKTLVNLLLLKRIEDYDNFDFSIITEFLDDDNRKISNNNHITDFIVSSNIISPVIAQLSEDMHLDRVFDILFTSEGSELYLRDACDYVVAGHKMTFATIIEASLQKNETCVGIIKTLNNSNGVCYYLNPKKSDTFIISDKDKLIVLAEEA
ncbi:MAG: ion transporter [Bacteroidota bacterium]